MWLGAFGFDPVRSWYGCWGLPRFVSDYVRFRRALGSQRAAWPVAMSAPCLIDRLRPSGETRGHYFLQDLFVARRVFERCPRNHVDVGSRVDGFIAHVAAFREVTVLDIRPPAVQASNIRFLRQDVTNLPESSLGIADSVSCLHALEHFGLGRYGDRLDPDGYLDGLRGLQQLLIPGGILYLSIPIGRQRIEFNGHRVFAVKTVLDKVSEGFELLDLSYIDDLGVLHERVGIPSPDEVRSSFGLEYGCGIFELARKSCS